MDVYEIMRIKLMGLEDLIGMTLKIQERIVKKWDLLGVF